MYCYLNSDTGNLCKYVSCLGLSYKLSKYITSPIVLIPHKFRIAWKTTYFLTWNEWGFRPSFCTYRLNWANRTPEDGEMNEMTLPSSHNIESVQVNREETVIWIQGDVSTSYSDDTSIDLRIWRPASVPVLREIINKSKIIFELLYCYLNSDTGNLCKYVSCLGLSYKLSKYITSPIVLIPHKFRIAWKTTYFLTWNEWGFRPSFCTYRLNWANRTPEDGEMNEMTLPSSHNIESVQVNREETFFFFET